ncbi:unnamed protein product [Blepharisma stoltei]|uniref:Uncharacterized protein n=1 Tax=Blepharisma stoltei TaxID=1481888 RepID=A0AAU9J9R7_9CILI|nr:unnamed protein product [Blepharisma stoltei]
MDENSIPVSLIDAIKARKQMERDAQLLANRIKLLQQEEVKTWKKIEETRKRTKEIMTKKRHQENEQKQKSGHLSERERAMSEKRQTNHMIREERRKEFENLKDSIQIAKIEEAKKTRMERNLNDRRKREHLESIREENEMRKNAVKASKEKGKEKINHLKAKKYEEFKQDYKKRIEIEDIEKQNTEKEVMSMELLEMELIKRLQNTQQIQQQVTQDLEQAISHPRKSSYGAKATF